MHQNVKNKLVTFVFSICVVLFSTSVVAQTPDDLTPSQEMVCDSLLDGVSDNLWGLCNAFCEAKDCDGLLKLDKSCSQLLNNFEKRSGGKISMPCLDENFCVDVFGKKHIYPVDACEKVFNEKDCTFSFQPAKACENITGNNTSACTWNVKEMRCVAGISVDKRFCCEDVKEKNPDPIEIREANPAYFVNPPIE